MKTKNIILIALLVLLTGVVSCKKDHDIPTGKVFNGGSGGGSTTDSLTISVTANPSEGGTVSGGGLYEMGQSCTVTAMANEGYCFVNWTENGNIVNDDASYSFMVNSNRNLTANFALTYTITVSANPTYGGSVTGGGVYNYSQSCMVTAIPASGYDFTKWMEDGYVVSSQANYTFKVTRNHSLVASFSARPQGAINGLFTINSSGDLVYFSKGNLQYIGSAGSPYWKFADNQWDYLGTTTGQNITNQNVDRDLFGWGTSGYHDSSDTYNVNYHPWSVSHSMVNAEYNYYGYGPSTNTSYYYHMANYDWGVYNPISNGGNVTGMWRTLTNEEWYYIYNTRNTDSDIRFAKAQVAGVNGVVLLPDDWSSSYYSLIYTNDPNASFNSNVINTSVWDDFFQSHGAVFLPTAGRRDGTSFSEMGDCGYYWSDSHYGSDRACHSYFNDSGLYPSGAISRYTGHSVRLVCPAE